MSGLSQNAQADLSSEKTQGDRIPHLCNILRFAVLKKNSSLMAIGGAWDTSDGGDPSVDDTSLIRTAQRFVHQVKSLKLVLRFLATAEIYPFLGMQRMWRILI